LNSASTKKILIIRLGGIGDVVCTLPALEAIRAANPGAFIGYAVEDRAFDLVNNHPALDRVHLFERRRFTALAKKFTSWRQAYSEISKYIHSFRGEQYDIALDFQRNLKGGIHSVFSGAKLRVGFTTPTALEGNQFFNQVHIDPSPAKHWVDKFIALAKYTGANPENAFYRLPESLESKERIETFLREHNISQFIAMHPTSGNFDPARRWQPERFGEVAKSIGSEYGLRIVVTFGPGEGEIAEKVVQSSDGHAVLFFETKSLLDLAELYKRAKFYIGCDTGPMHIAVATGLPCVVLFGSGDPDAYGPRSPGSKVIAKYAGGILQPMQELMPGDVMKTVRGMQ